MSSTASPAPESVSAAEVQADLPYVSGFAPEVQGRLAECDGGAPIVGTRYAGRQEFAGTLTGHYRDYGKYAWRWYLMGDLTKKPEGYVHEAVWCDADSLFMPED